MALQGYQAVLPVLPFLLLIARWTVPVEELEKTLQYLSDLHLPLCRTAGVQEVDHCGQTLQGQPWELGVFWFGGGPAAPRPQDREQIFNRVWGDGEKAILLKNETKQFILLSV